MKPLTSIVSAAIALIVCSCCDMQTDYFCVNTITLDNGESQPLTKLPHPDKWEVVGHFARRRRAEFQSP